MYKQKYYVNRSSNKQTLKQSLKIYSIVKNKIFKKKYLLT